ncbi:MAG TPA: SRPBCC domain-containing protein [Burkholderiaceae bacterium]|nr:SRPBCC domain-containing protein [Burkholderiaceae bacterium]
MHEIRTGIDIDATPARVWSVLTDFAAYPRWNPFVESIEGRPERGARLVVRIRPRGGRAMTFRPVLLVAEAEKELRWRGRFLVPGLFDGEHYLLIEPGPDGRTRLVHGERFSGVLVPLARSSLDEGTRGGFLDMNRALKARAESGDRDRPTSG